MTIRSLGAITTATVAFVVGCDATAPDHDISLSRGSPQNSEQVIFSGVADADNTFGSPVGFWIWCEADSENPYAGECNGSMYFYALHITRHVEGEITEPEEGIYTMDVSSTRDGAIVSCRLTNADEEPLHGPRNTVTVECDTPAGSATSHTAVVNVTGPPEE